MDVKSPSKGMGGWERQLRPGGPPPVMPGFESASKRLALEFHGAFTALAVEQQLCAAYDSLASTSTVHNFLSILAERSAREQLRILAAGQERGLSDTRAS